MHYLPMISFIIHSFTLLFAHLFIHSFIHFIYSFIDLSFTHSFIHSFIYFIYLELKSHRVQDHVILTFFGKLTYKVLSVVHFFLD